MITGFDHTGLVVKDIEKELKFYCEDLGLQIDHDRIVTGPEGGDHTGFPGIRRRLVFLKNAAGLPMFELILYINPESPDGYILDHHQINSYHLCFNVENLQGIYKDLVEKGVRFLTPPKLIDRPPMGDRVCLAYAQDPEGNWIEFKEVISI